MSRKINDDLSVSDDGKTFTIAAEVLLTIAKDYNSVSALLDEVGVPTHQSGELLSLHDRVLFYVQFLHDQIGTFEVEEDFAGPDYTIN